MQSFFKIALTTIGLVLILIGVVGVFALTQAQSMLTKTVDEVLYETFGPAAAVKNVSISPSDRALVLHNFSLQNPKGFIAEDALQCKRIIVRLKPRTLLGDTPVVEMIDMEDAYIKISLETGLGTNVAALANSLAIADGDAPSFKLEKLRCRGANLHLGRNIVTTGDDATKVVSIRIEELGDGDEVTPAMVTAAFLRSILAETLTMEGIPKHIAQNIRGEVEHLATVVESAKPETDESKPEQFSL